MPGSDPPVALLLLVALLVALPLIAFVADRLRLPYTVVMVLVGLVVSVPPLAGNVIEVSPEVAVTVLLPGLVFEAAYRLDWNELRRSFGGVTLLAVPGVLVCAAVVAIVLNLATGLPLDEAFIVGAIVSATDPVAVVATMRQLRAPSRLVTLVDAESLFNDGTAVLVYGIALVGLRGEISLAAGALDFVVGVGASIGIGALIGFGIAWLAGRTEDHLIELTLTLLAAYGTYVVAAAVHQSGIIAVVVAGITIGSYRHETLFTARARDAIDTVWEFLAFVLTGVAFLLIGIAISFDLLGNSALYIAWGVIAVLLGRALVIYGLLGGSAWIAHFSGLAPRLPLSWLHVINWTGLRGAVAMALALSLPEDVPDRQLLQGTIFGIVLFTVLVQGTTAERLVRSLGVTERKNPVV
jgi:CPA1 family monovalent cation:H+ antiporter